MKKMKCVFLAALVVTLSGCAALSTLDTQPITLEISGDSAFKQRTEFKDLPVEMQQMIMYGGGE